MSDLFSQAVKLEETNPVAALELYEQLSDNPSALINAGTIHYKRLRWADAEACYRKAIEIDPKYALAYFDLANVFDETGHKAAAIDAYQHALALAPDYADCHYNLAIMFGNMGKSRKSVYHFRQYLKYDPSSIWAKNAQSVIDKIMAAEPLKIIWRNENPRRTKRRARLVLVPK